jgi:hypothetical protein
MHKQQQTDHESLAIVKKEMCQAKTTTMTTYSRQAGEVAFHWGLSLLV